jgi:hypothetical protein
MPKPPKIALRSFGSSPDTVVSGSHGFSMISDSVAVSSSSAFAGKPAS